MRDRSRFSLPGFVFKKASAAGVVAGALLCAGAIPVAAQMVGISPPLHAPQPKISLGYTFYEGRFEASNPVRIGDTRDDRVQLRQDVVFGRLSQEFAGRFTPHVDVAWVTNRLDGERFDPGFAFGGGLQVMLINPGPDFHLSWIASIMVHDEVDLRRNDDTRMRVRNDVQTGFVMGREGDIRPLLGEEFTGYRTYFGVLFSARSFRVRSDRAEVFDPRRLAGIRALAGVELDFGERFGLAVEGHAGAAYLLSGGLFYRF